MAQKYLKSIWKKTKKKFDKTERELVDCYIGFLREVARAYLKQDREIFFKENRVVHWGEGNFGTLVIEGDEDTNEIFGDYIAEIHFEPETKEDALRGFVKITNKNIQDIKYIPY